MKEGNLRVLRGRAEAAWQARDYTRVVELYGSVREELTEVEAKKLAYAEQKTLAAEALRKKR